MKKGMKTGLTAVLVLALCACGNSGTGHGSAAGGSSMSGAGSGSAAESGTAAEENGGTSAGEGGGISAAGSGEAGNASVGSGDASGSAGQGSGDLTYLWDNKLNSACCTQDGYYYLADDVQELSDGNYGSHLFYMDFASGKEVYLCSTSGCKHDSTDCTSVYLSDEFPTYSTKFFLYKDGLYILSRDYDQDGSMSTSIIGGEFQVEAKPAVLYRMNPDGTERRKIYSFDPELTLEDMGAADDGGIYVITKKVSTENEGSSSYNVSSERRLMYLDPESGSIREVCSMDFGDNISWTVFGCHGRNLVLNGIDYGRELSREEMWGDDDDAYREIFENSSSVYATLDVDSGRLKEFYRVSNKEENSEQLVGGKLYVSTRGNENIDSVDIETGDRENVGSLPQNCMMDVLDDALCCRTWDLTQDYTWYFMDTKTGKVIHCALVNQRNGWELELRASVGDNVLVIYDYDAEGYPDGSYEIRQYKHALIAKEDLLAGKENYRKIEMVGPGM